MTLRRTYFQIAILVASFCVLYHQTILELVKDWSIDPNFSHGFFIPLISAFMIWQKRGELEAAPLKPGNWGIVVLVTGMLMFLVGNLGAELFTMRFSIIVTFFGLAVYLFGMPLTKKITIPLAYLLLMIPIPAIIWNKIAFPMQLFASKLTVHLVYFIGIPIFREGNVLHVSNTTLQVVDACSGLRSLTSLLALSGAFAYIVKLSVFSKWFLFLMAVPIAVGVNIFRLSITAVLAEKIGPEMAQGFLHELSGIFTFAIAFLLLFLTYFILDRINKPQREKNVSHRGAENIDKKTVCLREK